MLSVQTGTQPYFFLLKNPHSSLWVLAWIPTILTWLKIAIITILKANLITIKFFFSFLGSIHRFGKKKKILFWELSHASSRGKLWQMFHSCDADLYKAFPINKLFFSFFKFSHHYRSTTENKEHMLAWP